MTLLVRFRRSSRGAVAVMTALTLPVLIGFAALGIDYGSFLTDQRRLQGIVDLAALSAAGAMGVEDATARRVMRDNHEDGADIEVMLGAFSLDANGFRSFTPGPNGGAVLVRAGKPSPLFFSALFLSEPPVVHAHSIAVARPVVSLSAGSTLAKVSGGVPAALTQALLGTKIDLSLLGHDGLARVRITSSGLVDALAEVLGRSTGTLGALLDEEVSVHLLLQTVARQLRSEGQVVEASRVEALARPLAKADATLSLGRLLAVPAELRDLRLGAPSTYLTARIGVLGLLSASLSPREGGSALSLALPVPGLLSARLDLLMGDPMRRTPPLALGDPGLSIETAQVRARFNLASGSLLGALGGNVNLPLELAVAPGSARVVSAICHADPARRQVLVEVAPGALRLEIGRQKGALADVGPQPSRLSAVIVEARLASVSAHALATLQAGRPTQMLFSGSEILNGRVKTVGSTRMVDRLVDDLFDTLDIDVRLLGLGLPLGGLIDATGVKVVLKTLTPAVDLVLDGLLATLGVRVGAMDVRVDDLVCGVPRIVA